MIQAILLIFFGMSSAEQAVVAELACAAHVESPKIEWLANPEGFQYQYADGSTAQYSFFDDILVRGPNRNIVYLKGDVEHLLPDTVNPTASGYSIQIGD